ncbi:MAG: TonB-dependent receptor [Bacteroidia bacterium]|nr:TonB-dependent receptor [Bacteroidia bacterium]
MSKLPHSLSTVLIHWGRHLSMLLLLTASVVTGYAQVRVSGTVTDETSGSPVIGASVIIQGTTTGALTGDDGSFSLTVNKGQALVISMVSFETQVVTVGDNPVINVVLKAITVDEVVVTGYSSQRKRDITGAVSVIKASEMNEIVAPSFIQKIEGRATGVNISTSGEPGSGTVVRIRGISSFQNNDPLYIIDGVPVQDSYQNGLNPNDIESIQVLKDASAASIYGARANNGVVIVTTKKGSAGAVRVTYDGYAGVQVPVGKYDLIVDPKDYSEVVWRSHENANIAIPTAVPYAFGRGQIPTYYYDGSSSGYPGANQVDESLYSYPNNLIMKSNQAGTDWWDEVFDPSRMTEHTVGVSGGSSNSNFYLSANYLNQDGTMKYTYFNRAAIRANSEFRAKKFTFGENFSLARSQGVSMPGGNQQEGNTMTQILKAQSIIPVYDISGVNFAGGKANGLSNGTNPVAQIYRNRNNEGTYYRILGNAYGQVEIVKGLKARTSLGVDFFDNYNGGFNFPTWENSEPTTVNGWNENWSKGFTWTWTNTLTYNHTFADVHNVQALVGYEAIKGTFRNIGGSLANYFTTDINAWYLSTGLADPGSRTVNSGGSFRSLASAFAKVDYAFSDKYLISATIRRDGSSNFGTQKYGVFPAVSVGWRLTGESFLEGVTWLEDLKLRAGYGVTGNQEIPGGNAFDRFGGDPGSSFYAIGGGNTLATGYALTNRGNAATKWEENISTNIGVDASLMSGALVVVLDVYQRTVDGLLFNPALPATSGTAAAPFINVAKMENRGIDASATYRKDFGKLGFDATLNFSVYRNEILDIDGNSTSFFSTGGDTRIGRTAFNTLGSPIGTFYGFTADGIFRSEEEVAAHAQQDGAAVGRLRFKDISGPGADGIVGTDDDQPDGIINDADLGVIGSPHPDFTSGLTLGLRYGNFDASVFVFASVGNQVFNYNKLFEVFRFFNTNVRKEVLERSFHPTLNPDGDYPIMDENDVYSERPNSFYVENASYLRFRNIQVGYTLPASVVSKVGITRLRLYVQAQNAFTITKYSGIDPALSNFGVRGNADQWMGNDFGNYPGSQIFTVGLNLGF